MASSLAGRLCTMMSTPRCVCVCVCVLGRQTFRACAASDAPAVPCDAGGDGRQFYRATVTRRYSDFAWLQEVLLKRYPARLVPQLPPKTFQLAPPGTTPSLRGGMSARQAWPPWRLTDAPAGGLACAPLPQASCP